MKKFFGFFSLCLLSTSSWAMDKSGTAESSSKDVAMSERATLPRERDIVDDCVDTLMHYKKLSHEQQRNLELRVVTVRELREKLSRKEQHELTRNVKRAVISVCEFSVPIDRAYQEIKDLLDHGADPSLNHLIIQMGRSELIALLLLYGADPERIAIDDHYVPFHHITDATNVQTLWLLTEAGADITERNAPSCRTALINLCDYMCASAVSSVVLALQYGADPNSGPDHTRTGFCAIHGAVHSRDLAKVVALLRAGARIDVETLSEGTPLIEALHCLRYDEERCFERAPISRAQWELLNALHEKKAINLFDDSSSALEHIGISHASAERIGAAVREVDEAQIKCVEYAHDNIAQFVLGRELGRRSK